MEKIPAMQPVVGSFPQPFGNELEEIATGIAQDVKAGKVNRNDALDFEKEFARLVGPELGENFAGRLFVREGKELRPFTSKEVSLEKRNFDAKKKQVGLLDLLKAVTGARVKNDSSSVVFVKLETEGMIPLVTGDKKIIDGFYPNPDGTPQFPDAGKNHVVRKCINRTSLRLLDGENGKLKWEYLGDSEEREKDYIQDHINEPEEWPGWKTEEWRHNYQWPRKPWLGKYLDEQERMERKKKQR